VNYLGKRINLKTRMVAQPANLSRGLEITKAYLRRRKSSPAHIAGVAGTLLDMQKGNVALHGREKCIMREAAWMLHGAVVWKAYAVYSQKLVGLLKEALETLKHPVPHPIPQPPPPPQSDTLNRCERGELGGGVWQKRVAQQPNFTTSSYSIREPCTSP